MKRDLVLPCDVWKVATKCGNLYVTISKKDDQTDEIFFKLGKTGSCARAWCEAVGKLVTNNIRNKIQVRRVIKQWKGIDCHGHYHDRQSCPDGIATLLESILNELDGDPPPVKEGE